MKRITSFIAFFVLSLSICFTVSADSYGLQYSNYISTPTYYASQNCYGFAIGKIIATNPGYKTGSTYSSVPQFKACIISDLTALGYTVSTATSSTASLSSNQFMIAYCIGTWTGTSPHGDIIETSSLCYHFWRRNYNQSNFNHKFSTASGVMQFIPQPISANRQYTTDEAYNGITGILYPPVVRPAINGCTWGYLIVTGNNSINSIEDPFESACTDRSSWEDSSLGAQVFALLYDKDE